jgi:signal transduction histidine kinase
VFTLQSRPGDAGGLRHRVLDVVGEVTPILPSAPALSFAGPVDSLADPELAADVVAVLREALTNVARHAHATRSEVRIAADSEFSIVVEDDGRGIGEATRSSGVRNMRDRARRRGGRCSVDRRPSGGTRVEWVVPLTGVRHEGEGMS